MGEFGSTSVFGFKLNGPPGSFARRPMFLSVPSFLPRATRHRRSFFFTWSQVGFFFLASQVSTRMLLDSSLPWFNFAPTKWLSLHSSPLLGKFFLPSNCVQPWQSTDWFSPPFDSRWTGFGRLASFSSQALVSQCEPQLLPRMIGSGLSFYQVKTTSSSSEALSFRTQ